MHSCPSKEKTRGRVLWLLEYSQTPQNTATAAHFNSADVPQAPLEPKPVFKCKEFRRTPDVVSERQALIPKLQYGEVLFLKLQHVSFRCNFAQWKIIFFCRKDSSQNVILKAKSFAIWLGTQVFNMKLSASFSVPSVQSGKHGGPCFGGEICLPTWGLSLIASCLWKEMPFLFFAILRSELWTQVRLMHFHGLCCSVQH